MKASAPIQARLQDGRSKTRLSAKSESSRRGFIVVLDAGHGGKDTGAIGPSGVYEKDVVYAIARKLEALIRTAPGLTPVMARKGDQYVGLRRRAEIARNAGADLFISLHADAHVSEEAKGSAVFTLMPRGASSPDGGSSAIQASDRAAGKVLGELRKKQPMHYRQVQKARFAVLKSPDVPSMLIETGFVSNPDEEKNLASPNYQERVARSIFNGVRAYFLRRNNGPTPTRTAEAGAVVVASR